MIFMEQELRRITEKCRNSFTYVGRAGYAKINEDLRMRLEFCPGTWNGLTMTILNRNEGTVDKNEILFADLWGFRKGTFEDSVKEPKLYFSTYDKTWDWYSEKPSQLEYDELTDIIDQYIDVYQNMEDGQEQQMSL